MADYDPFSGKTERTGRFSRLTNWFGSLQPKRRRAMLIGVPAVVAVLAIIAVVAVMASGGGNGDEEAANATGTPGTAEGLLSESLADFQSLERELLSERAQVNGISGTNPNASVPGAPGDRFLIPKISVDAPMTKRVVGGDGVMENPDGPTDVAWYDFSTFDGLGGRPGVGGNTVISGHVDYHDYGPAVFWDLRKVEPGDEITIRLSDGSEYKYTVQWNRVVEPTSTVWSEIVAATPQESVTMITCAGEFDAGTRSYDQRRVVWAVRTG